MNTPNLTDLQSFAAVAKWCSFRKAALELGVTPSALSHSMRALETRLGLRLLHRTTRSVSLTEAGQQLLDKLVPALQEIALAVDEVNAFRDTPMGLLRINAPRAAANWVLPTLVAQFMTSHPGMRVEVVSDDAFVDIVAAGFDAGVRYGESLQQDMVAIPMGPPQEFMVVASPEYLARHGKPKHPRDLQQHQCIRLRFPSGAYYRWEFRKGQQSLAIDVQGPLTTNDTHLMLQCAQAGLGISYAYAQQARPLVEAGLLINLLDNWIPPPERLFLYYPSRRGMSAGLRAFIEIIKENGQAI